MRVDAEGHRAVRPGGRSDEAARRRAAIAERRRRAFELFLSGVDPVTIGRTLARPTTPHGYNTDTTDVRLSAVVRNDLDRAIRDRSAEHRETVREWRERLTAMHLRSYAAIAPKIMRGDVRAVDVGTRVLERVARLQGADKPQRVEVSASDPVVVEAVQRIMGIIGPEDMQSAAVESFGGVVPLRLGATDDE